MSILKVERLEKSFNELKVLRGVSFTVEQGDVIAIIGSSGSGKSTMLRTLIGLEKADAGSIMFGETSIVDNGVSAGNNLNKLISEGKIGMVFQHFNLFPHLTVKQNLELAPRIVKKQNPDITTSDSETYLAKVGLLDKKDILPNQLSGGQKQRVAIARALMMKPELLLFDEPTSALDPELTQEVLDIIQKLAQEKMTMLVVTHEMDFAREVANMVFFMDGGLILEQGEPKDIFTNPKKQRTREFLGSALSLSGTDL